MPHQLSSDPAAAGSPEPTSGGPDGRSEPTTPAPRTVMVQRWSSIVWAHWPVDPDRVAAVLPPGLTPETYDGSAWVGLVPFLMSDLRLPGVLSGVTPMAGVTSFGEVNVRTYVRGPDGRSGVWFATLDADRLVAVAVARVALGLPYRHATTRLTVTPDGGSERLTWTSTRRRDGVRAELQVAPDSVRPRPAAPGLEQFVVERYSLYSWWYGRLLRGSLSHPPWSVRGARLLDLDCGTVAAAGIRVAGAPHVLVGEPVEVRVHGFTRLRPTPSAGRRAAAGPGPAPGRR